MHTRLLLPSKHLVEDSLCQTVQWLTHKCIYQDWQSMECITVVRSVTRGLRLASSLRSRSAAPRRDRISRGFLKSPLQIHQKARVMKGSGMICRSRAAQKGHAWHKLCPQLRPYHVMRCSTHHAQGMTAVYTAFCSGMGNERPAGRASQVINWFAGPLRGQTAAPCFQSLHSSSCLRCMLGSMDTSVAAGLNRPGRQATSLAKNKMLSIRRHIAV